MAVPQVFGGVPEDGLVLVREGEAEVLEEPGPVGDQKADQDQADQPEQDVAAGSLVALDGRGRVRSG